MSGQSDRSHEERIRLKAYEIWLNEGKPEGRDARHWEMAREAVGYDDARRSTLKPATTSPGAVEPAAYKSKGEKSARSDAGESKPGPLAQQGRQAAGRAEGATGHQGGLVEAGIGQACGEQGRAQAGLAKPKAAE